MQKLLGASWRTSIGGLAAILTSLGAALNLLLNGNFNFLDPLWAAIMAGFANGVSLMKARDDKVTSEEAKAEPKPTPLSRNP